MCASSGLTLFPRLTGTPCCLMRRISSAALLSLARVRSRFGSTVWAPACCIMPAGDMPGGGGGIMPGGTMAPGGTMPGGTIMPACIMPGGIMACIAVVAAVLVAAVSLAVAGCICSCKSNCEVQECKQEEWGCHSGSTAASGTLHTSPVSAVLFRSLFQG
jgi:hypothetical protein